MLLHNTMLENAMSKFEFWFIFLDLSWFLLLITDNYVHIIDQLDIGFNLLHLVQFIDYIFHCWCCHVIGLGMDYNEIY